MPIALFWGGNDTLLDMDALLDRLSAPPAFCMQVKEYEHLHFLWGAGIRELVYPHVLRLLREYGESLDGRVPNQAIEPKVDEAVHCQGKGSHVQVGNSVAPETLCWGIDDGTHAGFCV